MNKRLTFLLGSALLMVHVSAADARDTHVGVDVDGENVDVQVFVNKKLPASPGIPKGYARDASKGCLYYLGDKALSDEYANWDGDCDTAGYIVGHGRLKYVYPSGAPSNFLDYKEGTFRGGRLHGSGTKAVLNGKTYTGGFFNGRYDGTGELRDADGHIYRGEFRNGKITGTGSLRYANGDRYTGSFLNGMRNGKGELIKANGDRFKGEFRSNRPSGRGLFIKSDGTCFEGMFNNGRAIPENLRKMQCLHLKDGGIVKYD